MKVIRSSGAIFWSRSRMAPWRWKACDHARRPERVALADIEAENLGAEARA